MKIITNVLFLTFMLTMTICRPQTIEVPSHARPLYNAMQEGDLDKVQALIKANPELVNEAKVASVPPLLLAIKLHQPQIAEFLVNAGADVNARDVHEQTALILAITLGFHKHTSIDAQGETQEIWLMNPESERLISLLLDRGANVNAVSPTLRSPLMIAVAKKGVTMAKELIKRGADVNLKDPYDGTIPLAYAAEHLDVEMARLLIKEGANLLQDWPLYQQIVQQLRQLYQAASAGYIAKPADTIKAVLNLLIATGKKQRAQAKNP